MAIEAVFLDIDGVLADPEMLPLEYQRLMGDLLAPALGGEPADWGRANAATFPPLFDRLMTEFGPSSDPIEVTRFEYVENVSGMCSWLGLPIPDEATCERLGREMNVYVRGNHRAILPGSAAAVRALAGRYAVHLATGNASWLGRAQLTAIGIRDLIGIPCGPDLVGVPKRSEEFYPRLFAMAGVAAQNAVVVDDHLHQLELARAAGARGVLVARDARPRPGAEAVVAGVGELPSFLSRM